MRDTRRGSPDVNDSPRDGPQPRTADVRDLNWPAGSAGALFERGVSRDGRPLLILGARTLAQKIADMASEIPGWRAAGFVENMDRQRCRETLHGLPILWVDELAGLAESHWAVCGLSTTHRSRFTEQAEAQGLRFATLLHPSVRLSSRSSVGHGSILSAGVIVAAHTRLGRHVLVNSGALIGHGTQVGAFTTIGPGAIVADECHLGEGAYIGIGAVVIDRVRVGAHSFVSAGSVVTRDVPDHVQVAGMPARVVRSDFPGR